MKEKLITFSKKNRLLILVILIAVFTLFLSFYKNYQPKNETVQAFSASACRNLTGIYKEHCWSDLFDVVLKEQGLEAGFDLLGTLYSQDPAFAANCHQYAHKLGEKAYSLFGENKEIAASAKASYCGYGFYHAFMEKLLVSGKPITVAKKFCYSVGQNLASSNKLAPLACFHGIGHGLLEDIPNPVIVGNDKTTIAKPLTLCNEISSVEEEVSRCASGVFNVLAIYYANPKTGLKINSVDPYAICRTVSRESMATACYDQMNTIIMSITNDFLKAATFAENVSEDQFAQAAVHGLSSVFAKSLTTSEMARDCQSIQSRLVNSCLEGFALGLVEIGKPGAEHTEAIKLCGEVSLTQEARDYCFAKVIWSISVSYPQEEASKICNGLGDYKNKCLESL